MKMFLQGLVYGFGVSADASHFAMILFARVPSVYFGFTESAYYDPVVIKQKVADIPEGKKYGTRTDKAYSNADQNLFTTEGGDRPDKPNALLLLTDGEPSGQYQPFEETIPPLEDKGVTIVAVGIGDGINKKAVEKMAGQKGHAINVSDFDKLQEYLKEIRDLICSSA